MGWGSEEVSQKQKGGIKRYNNNQSSIFGDSEPVKTPFEEKKQVDTFGRQAQGRTTNNIGGDGSEKTSVKVNNLTKYKI